MNSLSRIGLKIVIPALAAASLAGLAPLAPRAYADSPTDLRDVDGVTAGYHINLRPGGACDASWREEFTDVHGTRPTERDCRDRHWSLLFTQLRGRTPTDEDWKVHAYNNDGIFWDWREAPPLPRKLGKFEQDPRLPHVKSG